MSKKKSKSRGQGSVLSDAVDLRTRKRGFDKGKEQSKKPTKRVWKIMVIVYFFEAKDKETSLKQCVALN